MLLWHFRPLLSRSWLPWRRRGHWLTGLSPCSSCHYAAPHAAAVAVNAALRFAGTSQRPGPLDQLRALSGLRFWACALWLVPDTEMISPGGLHLVGAYVVGAWPL